MTPLPGDNEEVLVPLKGGDDDEPTSKLSRNNSYGSDSDLAIHHEGDSETTDYRIKTKDATEGKIVSLWHDISLTHIDEKTKQPTPYLNFVCEIPKFSRKKYEIATDEEGNPIKQDTKKGQLREFKKGDIYFNYGCFPQTWEDPTHIHPDAEGTRGDNDPLDVCEIGSRIIGPGKVRPVKVLGILLMIDEGECDWKVVVIDADDKWAPFMDDIEDVEREMPGMLSCIREWYRTYKIPDGKPPNVFGLDEKFMNKKYADDIIQETHDAWKELISGEKERQLDAQDDAVKALVRKLSKNSLFEMAPELDEQTDYRESHEEEYDMGVEF